MKRRRAPVPLRCSLAALSVTILGLAATAPPGWSQEPANLHRPVFLPRGDELIVMSDRDGGDWELYRVALDGSAQRRLTDHPGWDGYADVSSDGTRMVFDRRGEDGAGVMIASSDGGQARWLVRADPDGFIGGAHFAPDGGSILYASDEAGDRDVYRLWLDTGHRERLTMTNRNEGDGVFSPAQNRIAYSVELEEGSAIELLTLGTGEVEQLLASSGRIYGLSWSPGGDALFYNDDSDGDQDIYRVDLPAGVSHALTSNDVPDHLPVVAPDGRTLLFTSERDGPESVFALDLDTGESRRLELFAPVPEAGPETAILNVTVVPMDEETAIADQVVLVRDGVIERVGPRDEVQVKVFRVRREAYLALMEEATEAGFPVAGHVPDLSLDEPGSADGIDFDVVLGSGITSLEHILEVTRAGLGGFGSLEGLPALARRVADSGVAVGTLAVSALTSHRIQEDRDRYLREEGAAIEAMIGPGGVAVIAESEPPPQEIPPPEVVRRIIREFHDAGVRLVMGTDSHHPAILAGSSGLEEIELLAASGLTPYEALRAATVDAAEVLGIGDQVGTVRPGRRADLLLVATDPLRDPGALRAPLGVMRDGRWLDREDLDLLERAASLEGDW